MSGAVGALTREDRVFLKNNFLVWDPVTGTHADYSALSGAHVVCITDWHGCCTSYKIQDAFMSRFGEAGNVLLLEGHRSMLSVPRKVCLGGWPHLPVGIEILGSDIILEEQTDEESFKHREVLFQSAFKKAEILERELEIHEEIVRVINQELRNGRAFIREGVVQVSPAIKQRIKDLWAERNALGPLLQKAVSELDETGTKTSAAGLQQRNRELARCIEEVKKRSVSTIISIWGEDHFVGVKELFSIFEEKKIKYCVLVPSPAKWAEAKFEAGEEEDVQLSIVSLLSDNKAEVLDLPLFSKVASACDGPLKEILQPTSPPKIWINAEWLKTHQKGRILPTKTLCIENIDIEADWRISQDIDEEIFRGMLAPLFLEARRQLFFSLNDCTLHAEIQHHDLTQAPYLKLEIRNSLDYSIENVIITSLSDIWEHLIQKRSREFDVPPNTPLIITPVKGDFSNLTKLFNKIICESLPLGKRVGILGQVTIGRYKLQSLENNGLQLNSSKGFKFILEDKPATTP